MDAGQWLRLRHPADERKKTAGDVPRAAHVGTERPLRWAAGDGVGPSSTVRGNPPGSGWLRSIPWISRAFSRHHQSNGSSDEPSTSKHRCALNSRRLNAEGGAVAAGDGRSSRPNPRSVVTEPCHPLAVGTGPLRIGWTTKLECPPSIPQGRARHKEMVPLEQGVSRCEPGRAGTLQAWMPHQNGNRRRRSALPATCDAALCARCARTTCREPPGNGVTDSTAHPLAASRLMLAFISRRLL